MSKIHVRWLDPRSGSPREVRFSVLWLVIPVLMVLLMGWTLAAILRSSQSPERLRQKTDDLRIANDQLSQHLEMIEARQRSIRATLETVEENGADDSLLSRPDAVAPASIQDEELLDGYGIDSLLNRARTLREAMDKAQGGFEGHVTEMVSLPTIHPVNRSWPIVETYGNQIDLFTGQKWLQQGVAYATPAGTPVWATGAGSVVDAGNLPRWGNIVEIDHGNGFHSIYGHLQSMEVRIGQRVLRGQIVGISGNSGRVTAPQTFYAVFYHRKALDPATVLLPPPRPQPSFLDSSLFKLEVHARQAPAASDTGKAKPPAR